MKGGLVIVDTLPPLVFTLPTLEPTHELASDCEPECPILSLHLRTQEILLKYPSLNWETRHSPGLAKMKNSFLGISVKWEDLVALRDEGISATRNVYSSNGLIHSVLSSHMEYALIANRHDAKTLLQDIVLPSALAEISPAQRQEIVDWNLSILNWAKDEKTKACIIPLLPIQILWYMNLINYDKFSFSDTAWKDSLFMTILSDDETPLNIIESFCYHKESWIRNNVSKLPRCPKSGKVVATLRNSSI